MGFALFSSLVHAFDDWTIDLTDTGGSGAVRPAAVGGVFEGVAP